jgi:hypothetical protein
MRKYKKYWFYLFLILSISLTILVINDINDKVIPQIIQDINSGVIGAILTTIITLLLLSNQTESQENLSKSSVVYEEKLKIFNSFLETIGNCLEDGKLTVQETTKLIHSFSILRIHISSKNSKVLESALHSIDNSFFFFDENYVPNLNRLINLFNKLTNVFREELYGAESNEELPPFNFNNFENVLNRKRMSILKPNSFDDLIIILKNNSKILYEKNGNTIVFEIDEVLINSLIILNDFMQKILIELSAKINITYEINIKTINDEKYCGIPLIKLHFKNVYFGYFGVSSARRLFIGKTIPESKQVASLELFQTDELESYGQQITREYKNLIFNIDENKI